MQVTGGCAFRIPGELHHTASVLVDPTRGNLVEAGVKSFRLNPTLARYVQSKLYNTE